MKSESVRRKVAKWYNELPGAGRPQGGLQAKGLEADRLQADRLPRQVYAIIGPVPRCRACV